VDETRYLDALGKLESGLDIYEKILSEQNFLAGNVRNSSDLYRASGFTLSYLSDGHLS
jgi:hypothetical protein